MTKGTGGRTLLTLKVILLSDLYVTNAKTKRKKKKE
jgi:hypothetical protein